MNAPYEALCGECDGGDGAEEGGFVFKLEPDE
jgi:hypothetical protein